MAYNVMRMKNVDITYSRKHLVLEYDRRVGKAIAALRTSLGINQVDVARSFGCGQSLISKIEIGQRSLKVSEIALLAKALGITDSELANVLLSALNE